MPLKDYGVATEKQFSDITIGFNSIPNPLEVSLKKVSQALVVDCTALVKNDHLL